jgi:hypothetical protein
MLQALGMCKAFLSETKPVELSKFTIDRYFSQQQNTTGRWLRMKLLVEHNGWDMYSGKCKTYTVNPEGAKLVNEILQVNKSYNAFSGLSDTANNQTINHTLAVDWALKNYPFRDITYTEKSNRYWHAVQNLRKTVRNEYLVRNGIVNQYDIVCAAQTLLSQTYTHATGRRLELIESYIANRDTIRKKLANDLDLPIQVVKTILTALFAGARIVSNTRNDIFQLCEYDVARIEWMKQDMYLTELRKEISTMWRGIKPLLKTDARLSAKLRWKCYFALEKQVMDVIIKEAQDTNNNYYIIHDAIATQRELDQTLIKQLIKDQTKFSIEIERSNLGEQ